jgi:uncharacterized 2Fe-2S/4Fe-4S cluster protein (DUF4445 family)
VGKVKVGGDALEAVAENGMLDAGTTVVVVGYRGNELVVTARPEAIADAEAAAKAEPATMTEQSPSDPTPKTGKES